MSEKLSHKEQLWVRKAQQQLLDDTLRLIKHAKTPESFKRALQASLKPFLQV